MSKKYSSARGFTLIELLVVISIIALLLSIMMPSLQKARESARMTVCRANLKSAGLGVRMYATDNKDRLVPACFVRFASYDVSFEVSLDPYLKQLNPPMNSPLSGASVEPAKKAGIWQCPSDRVERDIYYHNRRGRVPHLARSYAMNLYISAFIQPSPFNLTGQSININQARGSLAAMSELWAKTNLLRENEGSANYLNSYFYNMATVGRYKQHFHHNYTVNVLLLDLSVSQFNAQTAYSSLPFQPNPAYSATGRSKDLFYFRLP